MTIQRGNDHFPAFNLPDVEMTETSDDDSVMTHSKYATKEDQDVAVFMAIAERLSISSLLHLLQGHAQEHVQYNEKIQKAKKSLMKKRTGTKSAAVIPKVKKFRFAEVSNNAIRCVVHEIESLKNKTYLWWTDDEMMEIRKEAINTVRHFRKHRPKYTQAIETIATVTDNEQIVEMSMKQVTRDGFARGLEVHIVSLLAQTRTDAVHAVLDEQKECKMCDDPYDVTIESLRGQSLAYSELCRHFARKMGEIDHIEALKATLSRWVPERC